ncbi:MAG: hypothetical protein SOZ73_07395 [Campylobacter sp.]|nr:hypothetical protein [Campylobacter sp.]
MDYMFYFQATVAKIALKSWSLYLIGSAFFATHPLGGSFYSCGF